MYHVFLSCTSEDADLMRHIRSILEANNLKTSVAEQPIPDTTDRADRKAAVRQALDQADALVAILSPETKVSRAVNGYLAYARVHNIETFPLLARGDRTSAVPSDVDGWVIDISDADKFKTGMEKLVLNLRLREQMKLLAENLPTAYFIAIITIDGLDIATYAPKGVTGVRTYGEENRASAMGAAMLSLGERIVTELGGGLYRLAVLQGETGTVFQITVDEEFVLLLGVREVKSIDAVLETLQQARQPLLEMVKILPPKY